MKDIKPVKDFIRAMVKEKITMTNMGVVVVDGRGYIFTADIKDVTNECPSLKEGEEL